MVHAQSLELIRPVSVFHGSELPCAHLFAKLSSFHAKVVQGPEDIDEDQEGIVLLDAQLRRQGPVASWRGQGERPLLVIAEEGIEHADFLVPRSWSEVFTLKALEGAARELKLMRMRHSLREELDHEHEKIFELTRIGLALSAEKDLDRLLTMILTEGRKWACCDAVSLFLVESGENNDPHLLFKLTQNDSVDFPFKEQRFPLDKQSIAGFAAVTGEILNLPDVYELPQGMPFHFNRSFDESINYRTRSMVVIPMKNHNEEVIGVLQFINRKSSRDIRLTDRDTTLEHTRPFTGEIVILLQALASQAAVAIGNTLLVNQIQDLFEGFVIASVHAIEQRDPTTSGHSFRVADFTTNLALSLPRSGLARFGDLRFSANHIREIRYASLLHDFGKVGVREPVLSKDKKLSKHNMELIWHRFELFKEQMRCRHLEEGLRIALEHGQEHFEAWRAGREGILEDELNRFSSFFKEIALANEPSILPEGTFSHLEEIRELPAFLAGEKEVSFLEREEFLALSVRKGTLTLEERREIESHVIHTFNFLNKIPWTGELARIPTFAVAHHEKLDGSGYPFGKSDVDIPLESKIMTISDIYDALTASDRPYKKAVPRDRALDILRMEAGRSLLDIDLVEIFIEAKIYETVTRIQPRDVSYPSFDEHFFKRNVCDHEHD